MTTRDQLLEARAFLKDTTRLQIDFRLTAQSRGVAPPPAQKPCDPARPRIGLPPPRREGGPTLLEAIEGRRSHRRFADSALSLVELSTLLWATQGVQRVGVAATFRPVPSAGARHAFETYLCVLNVEELAVGVYRYLPLEHALVLVRELPDLGFRLGPATLGQRWVAGAAVLFAWSCIPERMEWRYDLAAHRVIAMDAGHVAQNLYLACEAVDAGTCAIAAFEQQGMDTLLGLDGEDEFTIYLAPVGKRMG